MKLCYLKNNLCLIGNADTRRIPAEYESYAVVYSFVCKGNRNPRKTKFFIGEFHGFVRRNRYTTDRLCFPIRMPIRYRLSPSSIPEDLAEIDKTHEINLAEIDKTYKINLAEIDKTYKINLAEIGKTHEINLAEIGKTYEINLAETGKTHETNLAETGKTHETNLAEIGKTYEINLAETGKCIIFVL